MAQLIPNGRQQFIDINGKPLIGGRVYFYQVGTSTPAATWQDAALTIFNTNPVVLDARGQASIYGANNYRQVLKDVNDNLIWDQTIPIGDLSNTTDPAQGAALVGYKGRTVYARLSDHPMLGDYASLGAALAAAGNKTVEDPDGITYKNAYNEQLSVFTEGLTSAWMGGEVHRADSSASHVGVGRIAKSIEMRPFGSGANGPTNADYGHSISMIKKDWFNTTVGGEMDGQNITIRQGGRMGSGVQSDCAGTLYNIGIVHGSGWAAAIEAQTSTFDPATAAVNRQVQFAAAVLDSTTNTYYGLTATANQGVINAAFLANQVNTGHFTNFLQYFGDGGIELFKVDDSGRIVIRANSGATPTKTIRSLAGSFQILNDAQSLAIFSVSDTGSVVAPGSVACQAHVATGSAFASGAATLCIGNGSTASAAAGGAGAPPATVAGYMIWNYNNTTIRVPYYA